MRKYLFIYLIFILSSFIFPLNYHTLLVSNYPEQISEPGIILSEKLTSRTTRLMYYHINTSTRPFYIRVYLENTDKLDTQFEVIKSIAGPDKDGLHAGHISTVKFFEDQLSNNKESIILGSKSQQNLIYHLIKPNEVSTGLLEINYIKSGRTNIKVSIVDESYATAPNFEKQNKKYTYGKFNKIVEKIKFEYYTGALIKNLTIGKDPYLFDKERNVFLKGNYALDYDVNVTLVNRQKGLREVSVLLSPLSGLNRSAIVINEESIFQTKLFNNSNNLNAQTIYKTVLQPQEQKKINLRMLPQAGSYYPVDLIFKTEMPKYGKI